MGSRCKSPERPYLSEFAESPAPRGAHVRASGCGIDRLWRCGGVALRKDLRLKLYQFRALIEIAKCVMGDLILCRFFGGCFVARRACSVTAVPQLLCMVTAAVQRHSPQEDATSHETGKGRQCRTVQLQALIRIFLTLPVPRAEAGGCADSRGLDSGRRESFRSSATIRGNAPSAGARGSLRSAASAEEGVVVRPNSFLQLP